MADRLPDNLRAFDDMDSARKWMRDGAIEALKKRFPIEDDTYRLELEDPRYDHEENEYGLKRQKEALLKKGYLADRVKGKWRLVNKQTGQVMDEKEATVMRVPYLTNRGTFIYNGNEYSAASQSRLKNGVYTRKRQSGEIESFYSIKPGTGRNFKMWMEPKTGVFRMNVGQANMPLYPLLKELGVSDKQLAESWGPEVAAANAGVNYDNRDMRRYYEKFMGKATGNLGDTEVREAVRNQIMRAEVDPWVVSRTLGLENASHVSPEMLLRGSQKILNVSRGEEQPDDRNAPMYSRILSPEDFIRERIENDAGRVARTLLFKSRRAGNLSRVPSGALDSYTKEYLIKSRLTQPLEETNPLSLLDQMSRVTRMGEGGIGSAEAVTADARDVNLGQLGFIDPIAGPECFTSGSYIMTYTGFKPVESITLDDKIACLIDNKLEYHCPEKVVAEDYDGLVYGAKTKFISYKVTPNHRLWFTPFDGTLGYRFGYAADLSGRHVKLMAGGHGEYSGDVSMTDFVLPHFEKHSNHVIPDLPPIDIVTWASFLGWYLSEGNLNGRMIRISQTKKDYLSELEAVLSRMPVQFHKMFSYGKNKGAHIGFYAANLQLAKYLEQFGCSWDKYIPEDMFEAPAEARMALLLSLCYGDGRKKRGTWTYCTISRRLAESVERLCFTLGISANIRFEKDGRFIARRTGGTWAVHINKIQERELHGANAWRSSQYFVEPYKGKVYCVVVPGHRIYARYGNTGAHWTGNSETIGIDTRVSHRTFKGKDGQMYGEFRDARTGKMAYLKPEDMADKAVAFPGEMASKKPTAYVSYQGKIQEVPKEQVDFEVPSFGHMMNPMTNLNPMPTSVQAARQFYGSKFWGQYMPATKGETPLVDSVMDDGQSFSEYYGRRVGGLTAKKGGKVISIEDDTMKVKYDDGSKGEIDLVKNLPMNRLTQMSYDTQLKPGDIFKEGDLLATNNFVDPKTGGFAMGHNLKVAVVPYKGWSHEDAQVFSESAAKRLSTNRLYGFDQDFDNDVKVDYKKFTSLFPDKFTKEQLKGVGDNGVVKPGTTLNYGDPIILSVGPKLLGPEDAQLGKLSKALRHAQTDKSTIWEHQYPGIVTDAEVTNKGVSVNVKADVPLQVGDKCCYSEDTEVLTDSGWMQFCKLSKEDKVASLNPETHEFDYLQPAEVMAYPHDGEMYAFRSSRLDLLVTGNHKLFVRGSGETRHSLVEASEVLGRPVWHLKNASGGRAGSSGAYGRCRTDVPAAYGMTDIMLLSFLGLAVSCGVSGRNAFGSRVVSLTPVHSRALDELQRVCGGSLYSVESLFPGRLDIRSEKLVSLLDGISESGGRLPKWVFDCSDDALMSLLRFMVLGSGERIGPRCTRVHLPWAEMTGDVQRLCLHLGLSADVDLSCSPMPACPDEDATWAGAQCIPPFRSESHPGWFHADVTWNTEHADQETSAYDGIPSECVSRVEAGYSGRVWCCELPKWHVIYVRRNGKAVWCGNSTRYGLKGVAGRIVPDEQMPRDPITNEPYDVLLNPMTILSRVAPNQLMEIGLGKVAKRTGQPFRLPQLPPEQGWAQWTLDQMSAAGVPEKEDIFDPETGKTIPGIMTGYMYTLPFHHLSEKKLSGRGSSAVSYSSDELPVKGGGEGAQAKRMSGMDNTALICHGALDVLKDSQVIRGAKNEEYWKALKLGRPLPEPQVPFVYNKFMNLMRAGGINVMKRGSNNLDLLPMTDKDIEKLSGGAIDDGQMVDKDMNPVKGGLFDTAKAGGLSGRKWTHVDLSEPMPNPVFEEPIRRLLGISQKEFRNILSGRSDLDGEYGGKAFQKALAKIDVDKEIANQKQILAASKGAKRDNAVKCLGYLTALKKQSLSPKDWVITKVPVLPPVFRPVSRLGDTLLQADINELYRDVIESNKSLADLRKDLPDRDLQDERETLYDSVQAAFGLGDPITPEGAAKGLKGALRTITGNGSPKYGFYQSRVLSKPMDMVGRGAITPNPNLDMDSVGIPENKAWELYKDFVLRRLTRNNIPGLRALQMIENREPAAKQALLDEIAYRPVLMDRAPTWHKFNIMAYRPYLAPGDTVRVSPLSLQGMNGDFDGDCQHGIVPVAVGPDAPWHVRRRFESQGEGIELAGGVMKGSVMARRGYKVWPVDLADFPRGRMIGRRHDDQYDIDFYEVPKGLNVFAYDEKEGKVVLAEVTGWSEHRGCPVEAVTLDGGEQILTDDDPRGVYGINPKSGFGIEFGRCTPSKAVDDGVFVPVSSSPLVGGDIVFKMDPKTQMIGDSGIPLGWHLGAVVGIVAVGGSFPSRVSARSALKQITKTGDIPEGVISGLAMSLYDPDKTKRHLPSWFHVGGRDFLEGIIDGVFVAAGSICVRARKNNRGNLLVLADSSSLRLLREVKRVFRLLGVGSTISGYGKGGRWKLNASLVGCKRAKLFSRLPDAEMRSTFRKTKVSLPGKNKSVDILPMPPKTRKAITKWISQKKHCNLYHTIIESCKRGDYVTRECGCRIRDLADEDRERRVSDFEKAVSALDRLLADLGESTEPFTPAKKLSDVILAGVDAVHPYAALGAGDQFVRDARRYARWLVGPVYPDVVHALSDFFGNTFPHPGLSGDDEYCKFLALLESPVTWHRAIKVEKTGVVETGYDLTVPGYETFMSDEGVILSNTVNFHVPVSDKAVKNALDKMLPSKNLISLTDLRESMQNPRQEMALGLYALTRPPSRKAPVRFRTAEEAKAAYRQGKIRANDPIIIG